MKSYETLVVFQPQLSEEEIQALISRITEIIEADGNIEAIEEWGLRTLAYKIANQFTEGFYTLIKFESTSQVLDNLEHFYKINDSIIRSIIVKRDKK